MSEAELWGLMYGATEALQTEETTFLTILFGYLVATYFLAEKLSTAQLTIFNAMYLATTCGLIYNMWQHWNAVFNWLTAAEIAGGQTPTNGSIQLSIAIAVYIALLIASLIFMWQVRSRSP